MSVSKRKLLSRAWWLFLALTFLMSGVVLAVILAIQSNHQNNKQAANQLSACLTDTGLTINQAEPDHKLAGQKLASFTPLAQADKLACIDIKKGQGPAVQITDIVTVHYTGALAKDGTIFESSLDRGQPATFSLFQVITGWGEGLPGMQAGGVRRLIIPAAKAYGNTAQAALPAGSDLVFDIQLLKIGQ